MTTTTELLDDQDRYDAAFDLADELLQTNPDLATRLADLADEIDARDPRIGRDYAVAAVLSLSQK